MGKGSQHEIRQKIYSSITYKNEIMSKAQDFVGFCL